MARRPKRSPFPRQMPAGPSIGLYAALSPEDRQGLGRMEWILRAVFDQNETILDLLVEIAPPKKQPDVAARVKAMRDKLTGIAAQPPKP